MEHLEAGVFRVCGLYIVCRCLYRHDDGLPYVAMYLGFRRTVDCRVFDGSASSRRPQTLEKATDIEHKRLWDM